VRPSEGRKGAGRSSPDVCHLLRAAVLKWGDGTQAGLRDGSVGVGGMVGWKMEHTPLYAQPHFAHHFFAEVSGGGAKGRRDGAKLVQQSGVDENGTW
jgi:hypothetical protein